MVLIKVLILSGIIQCTLFPLGQLTWYFCESSVDNGLYTTGEWFEVTLDQHVPIVNLQGTVRPGLAQRTLLANRLVVSGSWHTVKHKQDSLWREKGNKVTRRPRHPKNCHTCMWHIENLHAITLNVSSFLVLLAGRVLCREAWDLGIAAVSLQRTSLEYNELSCASLPLEQPDLTLCGFGSSVLRFWILWNKVLSCCNLPAKNI